MSTTQTAYRAGRKAFNSCVPGRMSALANAYSDEDAGDAFLQGWTDAYDEEQERDAAAEADIAQDEIDRQVERRAQ